MLAGFLAGAPLAISGPGSLRASFQVALGRPRLRSDVALAPLKAAILGSLKLAHAL